VVRRRKNPGSQVKLIGDAGKRKGVPPKKVAQVQEGGGLSGVENRAMWELSTSEWKGGGMHIQNREKILIVSLEVKSHRDKSGGSWK